MANNYKNMCSVADRAINRLLKKEDLGKEACRVLSAVSLAKIALVLGDGVFEISNVGGVDDEKSF